jgi:uncharacterized protein YbbK (DUF523 family)
MKSKPYIFISSCLLGLNTQYDQESKRCEELIKLVKEGKALFFCAEQGGGLPTPRIPAEIEPGKNSAEVLKGDAKIFSKEGKDVTKEFLKGANMVLQICKEYDLKIAILRERSPSCGTSKVYDGTFSGKKIKGTGVTAELLKQNGIKVYSQNNFPKDL